LTDYPYTRAAEGPRALGLIVLQADETIESEFRRMISAQQPLYVSRVPSGAEVTPDTLNEMSHHLTRAAKLFPRPVHFASLGYGCTSASAQIGAARIADLIRLGTAADQVTDPLTALIAACRALAVTRLALLSPYTANVSDRLRDVLSGAGIATPAMGSFNEAREENVVRISRASIRAAALDLAAQGNVDAVFLSCTNLRTLDVMDAIETETSLPCLSSNQVMAWHMTHPAGMAAKIPGKLGFMQG